MKPAAVKLRAEARRAYCEGVLTVGEIAKHLGVTVGTISAWRLNEGWPSRAKGAVPALSERASRPLQALARPSRKKEAGLIRRFYRAIDLSLTSLEQRMKSNEPLPETGQDLDQSSPDRNDKAERFARETSTLIRNLEKAIDLATSFEAASQPAAGGGDRRNTESGASAADAERLRRNLVARLEKLSARRSSDGN